MRKLRNTGDSNKYTRLAHLVFCQNRISHFEQKEWINWSDPSPATWADWFASSSAVSESAPRELELTEKGVRALPAFEILAYCWNDGMPIYRRWVDAGIATLGEQLLVRIALEKWLKLVTTEH